MHKLAGHYLSIGFNEATNARALLLTTRDDEQFIRPTKEDGWIVYDRKPSRTSMGFGSVGYAKDGVEGTAPQDMKRELMKIGYSSDELDSVFVPLPDPPKSGLRQAPKPSGPDRGRSGPGM